MKMNAKKIQLKIFAVLLVAIMLCCGFFLAGCKDGNEKDDEDTNPGTQSSTTISLSEAKTIIVNALALDEDSSSAEQQGNRDLFEKFGMVQLNSLTETQDYTTSEMISQEEYVGHYEYSNNSIRKYLSSMSSTAVENDEITEVNYQEYSSDYITVYRNIEDELFGNMVMEITLSNDESTGESFEIETLESQILSITNVMFTDDAFDAVYKENVARNKTDDGFSLTLSSDYKGFTRLLSLESMTDDEFDAFWILLSYGYNSMPQELKDIEKFEFVLNFDETEQITSLEMSLKYGEESVVWGDSSENESISYDIQTMNMTISKYAGEITEPQWVTDYLANKESSN